MQRCSASHGATAGPAGLTLLIALANTAWAQAPAPQAAPVASAARATSGPAALAEEITVLRALKPLQLTPQQLQSLTAAVTAGRERLAQQSQTDVRALVALRDPVMRSRQQLFTGGAAPNDPQGAAALAADRPVEAARRTGEQNQRRLQDELTASLQEQLSTLLTPAQLAAVLTQGQAMVAAERFGQDRQREQFRQQMQQEGARRAVASGGMPPGSASPGGRGRGGGPGGGPERMLERLRGVDAEEYQRMSQGMARRFGDEGTPAYQNALAMFGRIRSMPDAQFRQQRATVAQQFGAAMAAPQSGAAAAASVSPENASRSWIRRYLLSPQASAALKSLSSASNEG